MTARLLTGPYSDNPCSVPYLSQSTANTLLDKSALHAWSEHPMLGNQRKPATKAMDKGQLLHKLVLGEGAEIEVIEADNYRTKLAQEIRDRAIEQHRVPMLAKDHDDIIRSLETIQNNIRAFGIALDGESEVGLEWTEPGRTTDVLCRCRIDHLTSSTIIDVKKTQSAHPKACARSVVNYGYHVQQAAYINAAAALKPELVGAIDYILLFIEVEPPYAVLPARLDGALAQMGQMRWQRAVLAWEECLATGHWPSYSAGIARLECPAWAMNDEMVALHKAAEEST
jgi:hypothetical protein